MSMSKQTEKFLGKMLEFLPKTKNNYEQMVNEYDEILYIVVIENVFLPEIIKLLSENKNSELLGDIFKYFEEVSNCNDEQLLNAFSVTVLEVLGNDKAVLKIAQQYMGPKTNQLQIEADRDLGRI